MKRAILLTLVLMLAIMRLSAAGPEKPTRLYTPVVKFASYATAQWDTAIWDPSAGNYDSIVLTGWIVTTAIVGDQVVILQASDPIVQLRPTASQPVISPGNFLWKGAKDEAIMIRTYPHSGDVAITLFGWEED